MTDPRPSENDRPEFPEMRRRFGDAHTYPAPAPAKAQYDQKQTAEGLLYPLNWNDGHAGVQLAEAQVRATLALVEAQQATNRHLEQIANELRMKNRVVGLS